MQYLSVAETAKKWNVSERSVRNYCSQDESQEHFLLGRHGIFWECRKTGTF